MKQNVKKKETYIPSSNGRDKLHVIVWIPQGEIKAVLQISHGMIEDMERYDHFARFMAARGILVCGNDHLGHGLTARNKSEMGYMYAYDASKTMAADVHRVTRCIKRAYPRSWSECFKASDCCHVLFLLISVCLYKYCNRKHC